MQNIILRQIFTHSYKSTKWLSMALGVAPEVVAGASEAEEEQEEQEVAGAEVEVDLEEEEESLFLIVKGSPSRRKCKLAQVEMRRRNSNMV